MAIIIYVYICIQRCYGFMASLPVVRANACHVWKSEARRKGSLVGGVSEARVYGLATISVYLLSTLTTVFEDDFSLSPTFPSDSIMSASSASVNIPTCLWAQRKDCVYVTVDIPDATDEKISVDANLIKFSAKSKDKLYECEMELFDEIDAEESKYIVRGRNVFFSLARKKDDSKSGDDEVYWPRLLKDKNLQKRFVKCDFNKWVDEDEEDGTD